MRSHSFPSSMMEALYGCLSPGQRRKTSHHGTNRRTVDRSGRLQMRLSGIERWKLWISPQTPQMPPTRVRQSSAYLPEKRKELLFILTFKSPSLMSVFFTLGLHFAARAAGRSQHACSIPNSPPGAAQTAWKHHIHYTPPTLTDKKLKLADKGGDKVQQPTANKARASLSDLCEMLHKTCFPSAPAANDHKLVLPKQRKSQLQFK